MKATDRHRYAFPAILALAAALLAVTPGPASAHGTTIDAVWQASHMDQSSTSART